MIEGGGDFELQATFFMTSSNSIIRTKMVNETPVQYSLFA